MEGMGCETHCLKYQIFDKTHSSVNTEPSNIRAGLLDVELLKDCGTFLKIKYSSTIYSRPHYGEQMIAITII